MVLGMQVANITKPFASVDAIVDSRMMAIMDKTGRVAKRSALEVERKSRDLVRGGEGSNVMLERAGGSFASEINVKSEDGEAWKVWQTQTVRGWMSMRQNRQELFRSTL